MKLIKWSLLVAVLLVPNVAKADSFNYTGLTAEDIFPGTWFSGGEGPLGGPVADDRLGLAQEFSITQETNLSALTVQADVLSTGVGTTTVNYQLFSGTNLPGKDTLLLTSQPLTFEVSTQQNLIGQRQSVNENVPFNYDLQPGTYWIGEQGQGGARVIVQQGYVNPPSSSSMPTAPVPEPSPIYLFGAGLVLMCIFKRKLMFA